MRLYATRAGSVDLGQLGVELREIGKVKMGAERLERGACNLKLALCAGPLSYS